MIVYLVFLIVREHNLRIGHSIVIVGSLCHLSVDVGYLILQVQLSDEGLPGIGFGPALSTFEQDTTRRLRSSQMVMGLITFNIIFAL